VVFCPSGCSVYFNTVAVDVKFGSMLEDLLSEEEIKFELVREGRCNPKVLKRKRGKKNGGVEAYT